MEPLFIKATDTTFQVKLDKSNEIFEFSGRSRPENIISFFEPIFDWFNQYELDPNPSTLISFQLEYFNSSTAKVLLRFLVQMEEMIKKGVSVSVCWKYRTNDEDILETGEDFSSLVEVPFEFVEY